MESISNPLHVSYTDHIRTWTLFLDTDRAHRRSETLNFPAKTKYFITSLGHHIQASQVLHFLLLSGMISFCWAMSCLTQPRYGEKALDHSLFPCCTPALPGLLLTVLGLQLLPAAFPGCCCSAQAAVFYKRCI